MSFGNDLKKLNDRIVGRQKGKKQTEETFQPERVVVPTPLTPLVEQEETVEGAKEENFPLSEVSCGCPEHFENKMLELLVPASVNKVFAMLYLSNSEFMEQYNQRRGAKGVFCFCYLSCCFCYF